jgi:ribonuclease HI
MFFSGLVMKRGAGVKLVVISPIGVRLKYAIYLHFDMSNNVAKYEALVNGLRMASKLKIRRLDIRGDS